MDPNRKWRADQLLTRLDASHNGRGQWVTVAFDRAYFYVVLGELFGVQAPIMTAALAVGLGEELEAAGAVELFPDSILIHRPTLVAWVAAQRG